VTGRASECPVRRICVVGAGYMGHQIAMACALGGFRTSLHDTRPEALESARKKLEQVLADRVRKGKLTKERREEAFARLSFEEDLSAAAEDADLAIEAVAENLEAKRGVFRALDRLLPGHAIIATNSSTIVASRLAEATGRPELVCNMHFFVPPLVMNLVEVVASERTSEQAVRTVLSVLERMGKKGIVIRKEIPGFVANRILSAIHREALFLYESGVADFRDIDLICREALGHALGPFQVMDLAGLDIVKAVNDQFYVETGSDQYAPWPSLEEKVKQGHWGRKTGKGWYDYS
jgi:3-hydroxybutyryl-CoA dehydrogenase